MTTTAKVARTNLRGLPFASFIGTSPSGVEWVAYRPEHVERLQSRLATVWAKHQQRVVRARHISRGAMDRIEDAVGRVYEGRDCPVTLGRTFVEGPRGDLEELAEVVADDVTFDDACDLVAGQCFGDLTGAQVEFGARAIMKSQATAARKLRGAE